VFAIRANHAFDGEDFRAGGATVLVDDAGIVGVEPLRYEPPSDCDLVDYGDATVLPGLIDTHVHLVGDSRVMALERLAEYSPEEIDAVVIESLRRQLAAGVTTVRDLGDWHFNVVERPTLGGFNTKSLAALLAVAPPFQQIFADAGLTPESYLEIRMSALRRMTTFGVRLISGDDAGIGPDKAHGRYAEAVIELEQVTDTMPALVAASSDAAAAIGLGRSKGRLLRGYDADLLVVGGDLAADLTALRDVRQVVLRGVPVSPRSGQS
jgi:imidazolonepropionase-like amidohydrolase